MTSHSGRFRCVTLISESSSFMVSQLSILYLHSILSPLVFCRWRSFTFGRRPQKRKKKNFVLRLVTLSRFPISIISEDWTTAKGLQIFQNYVYVPGRACLSSSCTHFRPISCRVRRTAFCNSPSSLGSLLKNKQQKTLIQHCF